MHFVSINTFSSLLRATDTCDVFSFDKDGCQSLKLSASLGFLFQAMLQEHLNCCCYLREGSKLFTKRDNFIVAGIKRPIMKDMKGIHSTPSKET